jgi:hypothetical protein
MKGEDIMTRVRMLFAVALLTASLLSGCVIVPLGGWYGGGGYHSHSGPYPYYRGR